MLDRVLFLKKKNTGINVCIQTLDMLAHFIFAQSYDVKNMIQTQEEMKFTLHTL